jgi:hypothetical protein
MRECESWSLALSETYRFKVINNRVLRKIFRSEREEVAGGWRNVHNEELHTLYSTSYIVRVIKTNSMRWARHVTYG